MPVLNSIQDPISYRGGMMSPDQIYDTRLMPDSGVGVGIGGSWIMPRTTGYGFWRAGRGFRAACGTRRFKVP